MTPEEELALMGGLATMPQNVVPQTTVPRGPMLPQIEQPDLISRMLPQRDPRIPLTDLQYQQRMLGFGSTLAPGEKRGFGAIDVPMGSIAQIGEAIEKSDPFSLAAGAAPLGGGGVAAKLAPAMFIGAGAKTIDKSALNLAKRMEKQGAPAPQIFEATTDLPAGRLGWERGVDKKWRTEISDADATVNAAVLSKAPMQDNSGFGTRVGFALGSILDHPELYNAYPGLKNVEVWRLPSSEFSKNVQGAFDPKNGRIFLHESLSPEKAKEVLLHELQHNVQDIEKFAHGGGPTMPAVIKKAQGLEMEVFQNTKQRLDELLAQRAADTFELKNSGASEKRIAKEWAKQNPDLAGELRTMSRYMNDIPSAAKFEAYQRMAGEAEARNTAARQALTTEGRFLARPETTLDRPREQQWAYRERSKAPAELQMDQRMGETLAPYPQFAERYPASGPPTMVPKDNPKFKGETYPEKTLTPEAEAFAKTRTKIMKQMEKEGYDPYFDPEKRFYVDPSKYPKANVDTTTVIPKKEKTLAEYNEFIDTPETRKLLRQAYDRGDKLGNANDWYAMGQLEKEFINEYGPKKGREQFLERFAVPMAATTSGNNPPANFALAHYFEYLRNKGEAIPEGHQFPVTVGGRRANVNVRDYESVMEKGGYAGLGAGQPKMHNFTRNFIGDRSAATMDEQMAGGMLAGQSKADIDKARTTGFGLLEKQLQTEAKRKGIEPANFQDVAWAGFKGESAGPMIGVINDAIERTHRLTGMPREEIVRRGIIRKEIPIYGLTGVMGGLAAQDIYNQQ